MLDATTRIAYIVPYDEVDRVTCMVYTARVSRQHVHALTLSLSGFFAANAKAMVPRATRYPQRGSPTRMRNYVVAVVSSADLSCPDGSPPVGRGWLRFQEWLACGLEVSGCSSRLFALWWRMISNCTPRACRAVPARSMQRRSLPGGRFAALAPFRDAVTFCGVAFIARRRAPDAVDWEAHR